jgi:hypothetical protein
MGRGHAGLASLTGERIEQGVRTLGTAIATLGRAPGAQ